METRKIVIMNLLQGRNGDAYVENRLWTQRGKREWD